MRHTLCTALSTKKRAAFLSAGHIDDSRVLVEGLPLSRNLRILLSKPTDGGDRSDNGAQNWRPSPPPATRVRMHNTAMHYARTILKHDERAARVSGLFIQLGETPER